MSSMPSEATSGSVLRSVIPARIDRLPWSRFHTQMVIALGVAWILDGLEITIAGDVAGLLSQKSTLHMSSGAVGAIATVYLIGEVIGALVFGRLSDKLGRRNLFMLTLGIYLVGSGLTAATAGAGVGWVGFLYLTRIIAGMGIGGEYAAINSAIDEMIPARYRGRVDIAVNGTYWGGSFLGTVGELLILNNMSPAIAWRVGFLIGPVLALCILFVRRNLPESPRWQIMHGKADEAEQSIAYIEQQVEATGHKLAPIDQNQGIEIKPTDQTGYLALAKVLFSRYPSRSVLSAALMITQSFLYNAIFFTYTLVLTKFFHVPGAAAPKYLLAFAAGNLIGPLTIGRLFDTIGRRKMISGTYILSGVLLIITAFLFDAGTIGVGAIVTLWSIIFFFASAGASAAYLTVSEIFPLEVRAQAIAVFFAIAQIFGAVAPLIYGILIGDGTDRGLLFIGYLIGAAIMIIGGLIEVFLGVDAEGKSLEDVADPLSMVSKNRPVSDIAGGAMGGGAPPQPGPVD